MRRQLAFQKRMACKLSNVKLEVIITYAHLPAGYAVCRLLSGRRDSSIESDSHYFFWGMFGSIAPDLDYLYQYFFDYRNYDHHLYLTHYPVFWIALLAVSSVWYISDKKSIHSLYAVMFFLNAFFHTFLDAIESRILWLAPFSYHWLSGRSVIKIIDPTFIDNHPGWNSSLEAIIIIFALSLFLGSVHKKRKMTESET